jgi:hypothetical protein
MNALEARAQTLETQKGRWLKLSLDTRKAIENAVSNGTMSCFVKDLYDVEIHCLRMLGYNVRDIVEDTIEISW